MQPQLWHCVAHTLVGSLNGSVKLLNGCMLINVLVADGVQPASLCRSSRPPYFHRTDILKSVMLTALVGWSTTPGEKGRVGDQPFSPPQNTEG
jgi:hypothetical protein